MPAGNIDYDRGVIINTHPGTGMDIYMYVDSPGFFLTAHAKPVPDELAKQAGYDVEKLAKERLRKSRREQALTAIDKELADSRDVEETVVKAIGAWKLVHIGLGRHFVIDPEGNRINPTPLTEEIGTRLLSTMSGEEKKEEVKVALKK